MTVTISSTLASSKISSFLRRSNRLTPIAHRTILISVVAVRFHLLPTSAMFRSRKATSVEPLSGRSGPSFLLELLCHKSLESDLSMSTMPCHSVRHVDHALPLCSPCRPCLATLFAMSTMPCHSVRHVDHALPLCSPCRPCLATLFAMSTMPCHSVRHVDHALPLCSPCRPCLATLFATSLLGSSHRQLGMHTIMYILYFV